VRYAEWVPKVLESVKENQNVRTRLVGLSVPALQDPLRVAYADVDAIEDALYDLEVLGLTRRRPNSFFNLTVAGRQAASQSIENVCGKTLREACETLTDEELRFVRALMDLSEGEYERFARLRYVDVDRIFEAVGLSVPRDEQESFLLPLVEKNCIDYREFETDRRVCPLFTGIMCVSARAA
jgi:hypothetical protein